MAGCTTKRRGSRGGRAAERFFGSGSGGGPELRTEQLPKMRPTNRLHGGVEHTHTSKQMLEDQWSDQLEVIPPEPPEPIVSPAGDDEDQLGLELPESVSFRVSPRTMQMLGRENISSPVTAVVELVKNAYDADATEVKILIQRASTEYGSITIDDNGEGMDWFDIRDKWLLISTDNKVRAPKTTGRERVKVGEKGIGRLAMNRIGNSSTIITNRKGHLGLRLELDWSLYESELGQLHEIRHPISWLTMPKRAPSGTTIRLSVLRDRWTQEDYQSLYDDLTLLVPPFSPDLIDFSINFECEETPELNGTVISPMMEKWEFVLDSSLTMDGVIHHKLRHRSGAEIVEERAWDRAFHNLPQGKQPSCGPLTFKLFFYLDEAATLRELNIEKGTLRAFLNQYHGVRIYRDRFRVKPYGDPGRDRDWLGLNLRKVQSPAAVGRAGGYRISGNQVVGAIFISRDSNPLLRDQTNREGLAENEAYRDLRRFVLQAIQFLERTRSEFERTRESRTDRASKQKEPEPPARLDEALESAIKDLGTVAQGLRGAHERIAASVSLFGGDEVKSIETSVNLLERVTSQMVEAHALSAQSQTDRQVLLGLATLGIAMATFGHETARSTNTLLESLSLLSDSVALIPDDNLRASARGDVAAINRAASHINAWGRFALDRIRRDKRRFQDVNINSTVRDVLRIFERLTEGRSIKFQFHPAAEQPVLRGFSMDLEAVVVNLTTNALDAMLNTSLTSRAIGVWITTDQVTGTFSVRFCDSGRGILPADVPQVFNPLFSTKTDLRGEPTGTGMGLAIVHDIVTGYGGTVDVIGHGELGGAEFVMTFPSPKTGSKEEQV
jgi:signal transduction histidine kinase